MNAIDRLLKRKDDVHGAPPADAEDPGSRRPTCPVCGGTAPYTNDDSSHDDC